MALDAKYRTEDMSGLVHHRDRGVQLKSIRYGVMLAETEVVSTLADQSPRDILD